MVPKMDASQSKANETFESRIETFTTWKGALDKTKLAEAGFVYTQEDDLTECPECGLRLDLWETTDDPLSEHRKRSPNCPFFNQRDLSLEDFYASRYGIPENSTPPKSLSTLKSRLESFINWPKQLNQKPKDLAQAGFFYVGEGDKVVCYACGVGLNNWESNDDVWDEHYRWSPKCPFLLSGGNQRFLHLDRKDNTSCLKETKIPDDVKCVVCMDRHRNVLSLPCRHLATCSECNDKMYKCVVCNRDEEHRINVYLS